MTAGGNDHRASRSPHADDVGPSVAAHSCYSPTTDTAMQPSQEIRSTTPARTVARVSVAVSVAVASEAPPPQRWTGGRSLRCASQ